MRTILMTCSLALAAAWLAPAAARADGCYACGAGSTPQCRDYCRYTGADTFDARKRCERQGCKITGPSSCPTGGNYVICRRGAGPNDQSGAVIASAQPRWCAPRDPA